MTEEESAGRFDQLRARFGGDPRVTTGTGFGANRGLRVNGRIFAIFTGDALTLKLPAARVEELVSAGAAVQFEGGKGRPMREWVTVDRERAPEWGDLAEEACVFVARAVD